MDDNRLKSLLGEIAQEEVGDDMNLWPEIQAELQSKRKRNSSRIARMGGLARIAALVLIFALAGAIGYAVYQTNLNDPSIPQDEITTLNLDETQEGVTVTLNWVYADEHRITVVWSEEYSASLLVGSANATLQTTNGATLPVAFGGGGGGGGGSENATIRGESMLNFDVSALDLSETETLDLVLTLDYSGTPPTMMGGGGGGGGGGGSSSDDESVPTALPPTVPPMATVDSSAMVTPTFRFEFSVPVIQAQVYDVEAAEGEASGFPMTISEMRVTPSLAKFTVCSPAFLQDVTENRAFYWKPVVIVTTDGGQQAAASTSDVPPTPTEDDSACYDLRILQDFSGVNTFTLEIPYLVRRDLDLAAVTQEDVMAEERFFAEMGIPVQLEVSEYGFGTEYADLNAVTDFQRQLVSLLAFKNRADGGWSFEATR